MKKSEPKAAAKLTLHRETLRTLEEAALPAVDGGNVQPTTTVQRTKGLC